MLAKTRRKFTEEFKREAVALACRPEVSIAKIASELGVDAGVLRRWVRQRDIVQPAVVSESAGRSTPDPEVQALRRELNRVKMERDILKKAIGYLARESE